MLGKRPWGPSLTARFGSARPDDRGVLRIGILGAAKIAPVALVKPARRTGRATVVAVAARDPGAPGWRREANRASRCPKLTPVQRASRTRDDHLGYRGR